MKTLKHIGKILTLTLIFLSCSEDKPVENSPKPIPPEPETPLPTPANPALIKGVKWRQAADEEFLQTTIDWWLNIPDGYSKLSVMKALEQKANAVIFRVDGLKRYKEPHEANYQKGMDDIIKALKTAKSQSVDLDFYLWARFWLERDGQANYGTVKQGTAALKTWFTPILNKAAEENVLHMIKGISLIETNCDRMDDVKAYALQIADEFNATAAWKDKNNKGFFQTRSLLVPGAGFGMDFRNVDNDNGQFFTDIQNKCAHFAFVYKFMKATHESVTQEDYNNVEINGVMRSWEEDMERNDETFTVSAREAYLNHFGLSELTKYIETHKNDFPEWCNIVFWGDKWDGISQTPPLSRKALHHLLLKGGSDAVKTTNTGYFFNLTASNTDNTAAVKFYLLDSKLAFNQTVGWSGLTVTQEWEAWSTAAPGY